MTKDTKNVDLILNFVYFLAKYSGFVYMPLGVDSSISTRLQYFAVFSISASFSTFVIYYVDIYLSTVKLMPSKIVELGANLLIKIALTIPLLIKVNNYINRDIFVKYVIKMQWCCKMVRVARLNKSDAFYCN